MKRVLLGMAVLAAAGAAGRVLAMHDGYVCFYSKNVLYCVSEDRDIITAIEQ